MALERTLSIVKPDGVRRNLIGEVYRRFEAAGLRCFGPRRAPAQLEGSKAFTKEFLRRHGIPTAGYATFTRASFDAAWVRRQRTPIVVKASGLAAGKGGDEKQQGRARQVEVRHEGIHHAKGVARGEEKPRLAGARTHRTLAVAATSSIVSRSRCTVSLLIHNAMKVRLPRMVR